MLDVDYRVEPPIPTVPPPVLQLPESAYLSGAPLLLIDVDGRIADANLALEVLLGDRVGCFWRGQTAPELYAALDEQSDDGASLRAAKTLPGNSQNRRNHGPERARFRSSIYGQIVFRTQVVPWTGDDWLQRRAVACRWELEEIDQTAYQRDVREAVDRERTWMRYAVSYDRVLLRMPYYRQVIRRHMALLDAAQAQRVADLGAGTGNLTERLLASGRQVAAVDSSRATLARLRAKPWARDPRLTVYQQTAESLPNFGTAMFDAVNILLMLYNAADPRRVLDEAMRILRPGGILVITEPRRELNLKLITNRCRLRLERLGLMNELGADLENVIDANGKFNPFRLENRLWAEDTYHLLHERRFQKISFRASHYGQCAMIAGYKP